jgi:group I intron endonuclease
MTIACGIYQIKNLINNHCYIGSSKDFTRRQQLHFSDLRCNRHHNRHLQFAWTKYKEENFIFEPLIACDPSMLLWYEQQFIDQLKPEYNIFETAGSPKNHLVSSETRKKMSLVGLGRKPTQRMIDVVGNRYRGKHFSDEHRKNISKAKYGIPHKNMSGISLCSPTGKIYSNISMLETFCLKHNLDSSHMSAVILGKRKTHKGWKKHDHVSE